MKNDSLAIVVLSCDKFSSLWPIFFHRLKKFFADIGSKVYLLSNFKDISFKHDIAINLIKTGKDISWSYNLKKLLFSLNEENILFLMDDGLLSNYVNNSEFQNLYKDFLKKEMNYLNLKSLLFLNKSSGCLYSELPPGTNYRSAIAPSFWKKSILLELLQEEENAWQFEIYGSHRSNVYERFYALNEPFFEFDHLVIKGKIDRAIYKKLKLNGEYSDFDLPVMTYFEFLTDRLRHIRSMLVTKKLVPARLVSLYRALKYR